MKNMSLYTVGAIFTFMLVFITIPSQAHHSHANYQTLEWTNLEGTVKEVHWLNPHVWVYLQTVDDKDTPKLWTLEGGSPAALIRGGWKKDSVKVGDEINVKCHTAKDGSNNCLLGFLTTPGGTPKEFD